MSYENGVESFKFGDDTGNNLWLNQENMYFVDEDEVENIYNQVKDLEAYSFEGKVVIDPALDVGDKIIIDERPVIYQGEADFQTRFIAQISSKISIKQKQETTVKTTSQKVLNRRVQSRIDEVEGKITTLVEETDKNSSKLTQVVQDIDGITQTVSSVEEQVDETNQNISQTNQKVTQIEQTVEGITQTVDDVQTNIDENYSTTEEMNSAIEQKAGSITSSVSESIENIQVGGTNLLRNSAPYNMEYWVAYNSTTIVATDININKNCLKMTLKNNLSGAYNNTASYLTLEKNKKYCVSLWLRASRAIEVLVRYEGEPGQHFNVTTGWQKYSYEFTCSELKKNFIIYAVSANAEDILFAHSIKLEEGNKVTAWSPAPEDNVKEYEFGTKVEQNAKNVQVAWNNESQNIKIENDNGNSTLGFYDNNTKFAEMGVNNVDNDRYISFGIPVNYGQNIQDGMAWGMQTPDGKFWPILYIKDFHMANKDAGDFSGNLVLEACNLLLEGINSAITCGNINITNAGVFGGVMFEDANTHQNLLTIMPFSSGDNSITILDKIAFFKNQAGSNSLKLGAGDNYAMLTDEGKVSGKELYISGDATVLGQFINPSLEKIKKNINKLENGLDIVLNTDIYSYNLKREKDEDKKHIGFVIGKKYKYSKEITSRKNNGANLYSMISVAYKAIQEQQELIEKQNNTIKDLQDRIEKLEQKVGVANE